MTALLRKTSDFLFRKDRALARLRLLEVAMAVTVILMVLTERDTYFWRIFFSEMPASARPWSSFLFLPASQAALKLAVVACASVYLATRRVGFLLATTAAYAVWAGALFHVHDGIFKAEWNPHGFLTTILIVMCLPPAVSMLGRLFRKPGWARSDPALTASWVVGTAQVNVLLMYAQAGLAKLIDSGSDWMSGRILVESILLIGPARFHFLASHGALMRVMAAATVVFEIGLSAVFALSPGCAGLLGIAFHIGSWALLGVSFWFLLLLYPALFFGDWILGARQADPGKVGIDTR